MAQKIKQLTTRDRDSVRKILKRNRERDGERFYKIEVSTVSEGHEKHLKGTREDIEDQRLAKVKVFRKVCFYKMD